MTLYGPNWNGVYWEQNTTQGTDSLAAIIDATNPMLTKVFKIIFIISGSRGSKSHRNNAFSMSLGADYVSGSGFLRLPLLYIQTVPRVVAVDAQLELTVQNYLMIKK